LGSVPFFTGADLIVSWFGAVVFHICPSVGENSSTFFITTLLTESNGTVMFYFSQNESEWNARKIPLSTFAPWSDEHLLQSTMTLSCLDTQYPCEMGVADLGTSCLDLWVSMPRRDGNPLWPIPRMFLDDQLNRVRFEDLDLKNESVLLGNRLSTSLLLEYYFKSDSRLTVPDWRTNLEQKCHLTFHPWSLIATESGKFLRENIALEGAHKHRSCSTLDFLAISDRIEELLEVINDEEADVFTLRFQIDTQTLQDEWQGCDIMISSLLTTSEQFSLYESTTVCDRDMMQNETLRNTDPCCNDTLEWERSCSPRDVETMKTVFHARSDLNDSCLSSECVQDLLKEYIFFEDLMDSEAGCNSAITESLDVYRAQHTKFYRDCKEAIFGSNFQGINCLKDSDCVTNRCDQLQKQCVFSEEEKIQTYKSFFHCIAIGMSPSVRKDFVEAWSVSGDSVQEIVQALFDNFMTQQCVSEYGLRSHSFFRRVLFLLLIRFHLVRLVPISH